MHLLSLLAAFPALALSSPPPPLTLTESSTFKIVQFADLHTGEGEAEDWGPESDRKTYEFLSSTVHLEEPDLVVFSGDQVTGLNVHYNATDYYQRLSDLLQETPHTLILGNHDAEPFVGNGDQSEIGAISTRSQLMVFDAAQPYSHSQLGPKSLLPAASSYIVDVLHPQTGAVAIQLVHLDSGGGGMPEEIYPNQVAWLQKILAERRIKHDTNTPTLVFIHIPFAQMETIKKEGGECWGTELDGVTPTNFDSGLFNLLEEFDEVRAVFSGHDHCNSFCCEVKKGLDLCFGRHSSFGGYGCEGDAEEIGARVVEMQVDERGEVGLETYLRMHDGRKIETHAL